MGENEVLFPAKTAAVEKEVEVERAGPVPDAGPPAGGPLEALHPREEGAGREACPSRENGVDEIGLRRAADGARPVEGREPRPLDPARQGARGTPHGEGGGAHVGAEADGDEDGTRGRRVSTLLRRFQRPRAVRPCRGGAPPRRRAA